MRFLLSVIDHATGTGTAEEMAAIDEFNAGLIARGQLVFAGGLSAPAEAVVVDNRADAGVAEPGPLHPAEQYISGTWIIEAEDREAGLELASQASLACHRRIEFRPFL